MVCPNVGDEGEIVGPLMTGGFLSTSNGPNGPCGVEAFPAMSCTVTAAMVALLVSVPAGTAVDTLNEAGPARPEPPALSLAVQGTVTSVACHAGAGAVQLTVRAIGGEEGHNRCPLRRVWNGDRSCGSGDGSGRWAGQIHSGGGVVDAGDAG